MNSGRQEKRSRPWSRATPPVIVATAFAAALLAYAPTSHPQTQEKTSIDDYLAYDGPNRGDIPAPDCVEIAPMASAGDPTAGSWTAVPNGAWSGILARTGIIPGQTDPDSLAPRPEAGFKGAPGFIDNIVNSQVLNPSTATSTSKRATFGYFVRITQTIRGNPVTREFFLLMSYDYIDQGTPGQNPAAFEVFVFGPLPTPGIYGGGADGTLIPLKDGLPVGGDGGVLDAVPANIALVNNYKGDKAPPNTQVTGGVDEPGHGCFQCHDRSDEFPNSTSPFPWKATFGQFKAALTTHTNGSGSLNCPPPATSSVLQGGVLQGGVLQGVGVAPPETKQPNRGGEEGDGEQGGGGSEGSSRHDSGGEGASKP